MNKILFVYLTMFILSISISWGDIFAVSEPSQGTNTNNLANPSDDRPERADIVMDGGIVHVVWDDFYAFSSYFGTNATEAPTQEEDIIYRRLENGVWSDFQLITPNTNPRQIYPAIATENGNVHVVWQAPVSSSQWAIYYSKLDNSTTPSWSAPIEIQYDGRQYRQYLDETSPLEPDATIGFMPVIAAENGHVYVAWRDKRSIDPESGTDSDIYFRHYNPATRSWGNIVYLSEPGGSLDTRTSLRPAIAVKNGIVYVAWVQRDASDNWDLYYRKYENGAWSSILVAYNPPTGRNLVRVSLNMNASNHLHMAWSENHGGVTQIYYRYFDGNTWSNVENVSNPLPDGTSNTQISEAPDISCDACGIHITWHDGSPYDNSGTDLDIFYRRRSYGGTWSDIDIISEPTTGSNTNYRTTRLPRIASNSSNIHIVWADKYEFDGYWDWDIFHRSEVCPGVGGGQGPPGGGVGGGGGGVIPEFSSILSVIFLLITLCTVVKIASKRQ
jgi:hypothetical protein